MSEEPAILSSVAFANEKWLWATLVLILAGLVFLWISYSRSPLRGPVRWIAIALKAFGLILLALALMEPVWVKEFPKKGANDLVILADNSQGLAVSNPQTNKKLGEEMMTTLKPDSGQGPPAWLTQLGDEYRLQNYVFDRRLNRSDDFADLDLKGNASSLFTSLRNVKSRYAKRPLIATIVFSDGNATDTDSMDEVLKILSDSGDKEEKAVAPIFPVLVGSGIEDAVDLSLDSVTAAQSAFEDAPLSITAELSAAGKKAGQIEVYVRDGQGKEVIVEKVSLPSDGKAETVRLRVAGVVPGVSFYRVGVRFSGKNLPRELTLENNERVVAVNRTRGPHRILYVSGRPNWEFKFLRRAIAGDADLDLVALIRIAKREPKFEWRGRMGESSNPLFRGFESDIPEETKKYDQPVLVRLNTKTPEELRDGFPKTEEELFSSYKAIILDDIEAEFFTAEQQNLMDRFCARRGGTVLMLGGQESFQLGEWENTPVGRILPVYLDKLNRGGPSFDAAYSLSREGWLEPWLRLREARQEEEIRLAHMPGFFSVNQISAIKPGASVLASVTDAEGRNFPALITQRYGEGRTGSLTIADFWRWGMKDESLQEDMAKSWRQLLRWTVTDTPGRVRVETKSVTEGTLPVTAVTVRVRDDRFEPQDDASVKMELTAPDGEKTTLRGEPSLEEAGLFSARHFAEDAGGYHLLISARNGEGELIEEEETGWALNPAAEEFRSIGPNRETLEKVAEATGGKVLDLSELGKLPDLLREYKAPVSEVQQQPLWHTPWFFLLALVCFLGEWGLRRWKGVL